MSVFTLPIDKTASKSSHQVPGEIHDITGSSVRVIIPHGGAFYTKDFYLGNPENINQQLELGTDYGFEGFDPDIFTLTGFEVATAIWIKNPALDRVTIDYRRVGGRIGSNTALIHQLREAIQRLEAEGVSWDSIRNKPEVYPVEDHNHSIITDLTDLEELRNQFEKLTEALISQRPLRDSGLQLRTSLDRLFGIVHDVRVDLNKQSTIVFNALEQEVIKTLNDTIDGLSIDGAETLIQEHESKELGAHVASSVDFVESGGGSTNLQDKITSIISAISTLNQTNDDQDSDISNLGTLVNDLNGTVNSFSSSITTLENSLQTLSDSYDDHLNGSTTSHPSSAISHAGTSLSGFLTVLSNSVSSNNSTLSDHIAGTNSKHSSSDITHGSDTVEEALTSLGQALRGPQTYAEVVVNTASEFMDAYNQYTVPGDVVNIRVESTIQLDSSSGAWNSNNRYDGRLNITLFSGCSLKVTGSSLLSYDTIRLYNRFGSTTNPQWDGFYFLPDETDQKLAAVDCRRLIIGTGETTPTNVVWLAGMHPNNDSLDLYRPLVMAVDFRGVDSRPSLLEVEENCKIVGLLSIDSLTYKTLTAISLKRNGNGQYQSVGEWQAAYGTYRFYYNLHDGASALDGVEEAGESMVTIGNVS